LNARLSKTFGFGKLPESNQASAQGGGGGGGRDRGYGGGGGGSRGGFGLSGGGMGGMGSATNRRYNLTLSVNARNVFNYTNLATPTAVLNPPEAGAPFASESRFFGISNGLAGGPFSSQSASRLVYLQLGFTF
jgi:hypothetical protein